MDSEFSSSENDTGRAIKSLTATHPVGLLVRVLFHRPQLRRHLGQRRLGRLKTLRPLLQLKLIHSQLEKRNHGLLKNLKLFLNAVKMQKNIFTQFSLAFEIRQAEVSTF